MRDKPMPPCLQSVRSLIACVDWLQYSVLRTDHYCLGSTGRIACTDGHATPAQTCALHMECIMPEM